MTEREELQELKRIEELEAREAGTSVTGTPPTLSNAPGSRSVFKSLSNIPEAIGTVGKPMADIALKTGLPIGLTAAAAYGTRGLSLPVQLAAMGTASWMGARGNELMGITAPSGFMGQAVDVVGGLGPGATMRAVKQFTPFVGRKGEVLANKAAATEVQQTLDTLIPTGGQKAIDAAFKTAKAMKDPIPTDGLAQAVKEAQLELYDVRTKSAKAGFKDVSNRITDFKDLLTYNPNGLKPAVMQKELEALGDLVSRVKTEGGSGAGLLAKLGNAFERDLEIAAALGNKGASVLLGARRDTQRFKTVVELKEALAKSFRYLRGEGGEKQLAGNTFLNKLENPDLQAQFQRAFSPIEQQDILRVATLANEVPKITPKDTLASWTARVIGQSSATAVGGILGYSVGQSPKATIIGSVAAVAATESIVHGRRIAASMKATMQTQAGRDMVEELRKSGTFTKLANVLGAGGVAATKQAPASIQQQLDPQPENNYGTPSSEQEALEEKDLTNLIPQKGLIGLMLGSLALQSRSALGTIRVLKDWLKANPDALPKEKEAAIRLLQKAQSEHIQAKEARRAYGR